MWQGIHGHDQVVDRFRSNLACGRMASSYLFLGPEGIGKRSFALQLAKALLCTGTSPDKLDACGQCDSCRLADAGNHPDIDSVEPPQGKRLLPIELFIGRKEQRHKEGLCHNLSLRPMIGRRRIAIIDDADCFTPPSANCLLKTLEEPPPGTVLILVGTNLSRQLPTILSRTQIVRFQPLEVDVVSRLLLEQGTAETTQKAERLAAESGGSLYLATSRAEMAMDDFQERFQRQFSVETLDGSRLVGVISDFVNDAGTEAESRRRRLRAVFDAAIQHLGTNLRANAATATSDHVRINRMLAALDRCQQAEEELDRNANLATLLECWVDDLARILSPLGGKI
ncbi:DNA polymerase III subunit [Bythopirellula polymerisocia]|uniref:DNA polymerase III subunit tau n=1 Tax=Bythopirellula polymerisocia TaxID=2528003 RepID=A0A5C6CQ34_9BACT|nr:DNA polymerase III subunit [Bythopirellula polymerisocia]TWU25727.1 DNA polymerase III subunit tau [Bythopirellula polymerisocia]